METRDSLPVHAINTDEMGASVDAGAIQVAGLVKRPHMLSAAQLAALPRARLVERFACEEGWSVDNLAWEGIPLGAIITQGQPLPEARYARVYAGNYWVALPLSELNHALLCDRLNGAPLAPEHGAPWRLVVSGGACFTSVKWVSALELAAEPGDATAEKIARGRIGANDTR